MRGLTALADDAYPDCHSVRQTMFAHPYRHGHTFGRPVIGYDAAQLGSHTPLHQVASEAVDLVGSNDRRPPAFGPSDDGLVVTGIARYVDRATCCRQCAIFGRVGLQFMDD